MTWSKLCSFGWILKFRVTYWRSYMTHLLTGEHKLLVCVFKFLKEKYSWHLQTFHKSLDWWGFLGFGGNMKWFLSCSSSSSSLFFCTLSSLNPVKSITRRLLHPLCFCSLLYFLSGSDFDRWYEPHSGGWWILWTGFYWWNTGGR